MSHFRGHLVREARQARGLTSEALAFEVGVTLRTVTRWQAPENAPTSSSPRGAQLLALAAALGVPPDAFYEDDADEVAAA